MATSLKAISAKSRPAGGGGGGDGFGGAGYGGSGRALGARGAPDPEKILEAQRAREQLLMNIAKVMADNKLEALAFKSVEHQPSLIAEAAFPPYKSNGGVVSLNTFLIYTPII